MSATALQVLYEDNHLLAVAKPAGISTMGVRRPAISLADQARAWIKDKYKKPSNVYLGIVSRIDAPVSGVVLFARTSKAAARLCDQFRGRDVQKTYLALVDGRAGAGPVECRDYLTNDELNARMAVVDARHPRAALAILTYRSIPGGLGCTLLEVRPQTGRKHQIRVQLSSRGLPVLGDKKYTSRRPFPSGIALHAWRLTFDHPVRHEPVTVEAPIPPAWSAFIDDPAIASRLRVP
jgi:23S rRNA pseudouridine1911/1915/1917 synthase